MNRCKWRSRPTFLDSDWMIDLLRKFRVKSAGQIPPEAAKQGTKFDQVEAVSASACTRCTCFCMVAGSSVRNAVLMNECCWVGILEQFPHCISVGGSRWTVEAERHNSCVSLPHKMLILKLCVGRKRGGHLWPFLQLVWPVARLLTCCILDWYLGKPFPLLTLSWSKTTRSYQTSVNWYILCIFTHPCQLRCWKFASLLLVTRRIYTDILLGFSFPIHP